MKLISITFFLFVKLSLIVMEVNPQSMYYLQNSGTTANLHSVTFVDALKGWAVGDSTVLITTDGGLNWIHQIDASNFLLHDVFFINGNIGWIAGENLNPNAWPGVLIKTTNSGVDWQIQLHPYMQFKKIHFVDPDVGYSIRILDGNNLVSKTGDGGLTWTNIYFPILDYYIYNNIYFINQDTGMVVGELRPIYGEVGSVDGTTDGGTTWNTINSAITGTGFNSVFFVDDTTGWVVGEDYGRIIKTTNAGLSWNLLICPGIYDYNDVYFIDKQYGWVVGEDGIIINTINGGSGWLTTKVGVTRDLNSIYIYKKHARLRMWIVGDNGIIISNTHGEILSVDESPILTKFSVYQNYPNPFNPSTIIRYNIPERSYVTIEVYDVLGNEIATLVNEELSAGEYEVTFDSHSGEVRNLVSGIYFYTLRAGDFIQTKKMILMK